MKLRLNRDNIVIEKNFMWAAFSVVTITALLVIRLWYVQVFKGEYYQKISEINRIRRIEIPAPRGIIYDRFGEVVLGNRPFYDLVYVPQYIKDKETTFKILSRLLHIPISVFERKLVSSRDNPKFLPITLKRNLTLHEVSVIETNRVFLPGIEISVAPRRDYKNDGPPHLLGYLAEIDQKTLKKLNQDNPDNYYLPGELIGKMGLESKWETYLRGKRGYRFIQVDAFGRQANPTTKANWQLPIQTAIPGANLQLTIDLALQRETLKAFESKYGAVIVLDPRNGQILAMVSEPGFEPTKFQEGISQDQWRALTINPFFPFLDKTTGGQYPPGSIFKAVIAMAGLQEKIITPGKQVYCTGTYTLGDQTFGCWHKPGHGYVNLHEALMKSCDIYFYHLGVELGVDRIAKYAKLFGLGEHLGVNLNKEEDGLVPTALWKQLVHGLPWTAGDTPNLAIGQGFNLVTPIQMATLYAAIANGGTVWRPYVVSKIFNHVGETILQSNPEKIRTISEISPEIFALIRKYLTSVVMNPDGTGKNAKVDGVTVAGKTGTAQVVSLKKSLLIKDVSFKWKDHAIFAAFSPAENAEMALAIISENDAVSGGGGAAAPIAQKIIKAYWDIKKQRQGKNVVKSLSNQSQQSME